MNIVNIIGTGASNDRRKEKERQLGSPHPLIFTLFTDIDSSWLLTSWEVHLKKHSFDDLRLPMNITKQTLVTRDNSRQMRRNCKFTPREGNQNYLPLIEAI